MGAFDPVAGYNTTPALPYGAPPNTSAQPPQADQVSQDMQSAQTGMPPAYVTTGRHGVTSRAFNPLAPYGAAAKMQQPKPGFDTTQPPPFTTFADFYAKSNPKEIENGLASATDDQWLSMADEYAKHYAPQLLRSQGRKLDKPEIDAISHELKMEVYNRLPQIKSFFAQKEGPQAALSDTGLTGALAQHALGAAETGGQEALTGVPGVAANLLMGPAKSAIEQFMPGVAATVQQGVKGALNPLMAPGAKALGEAGQANLQANKDLLAQHPTLTSLSEAAGGIAPYVVSGLAGPAGPVALGMAQSGGAQLKAETDRINAMPQDKLEALPEYQHLLAATNDPAKAKDLLIKASSEAAEKTGQVFGGLMGLIGGGGMTKPVQMAIAKAVGESTLKRVLATAGAEAGGFTGQQVAQNVLATKATNVATGEKREPDLLAGTEQSGIMGAIMGTIGALLHGKGAVKAPAKPTGEPVRPAPGVEPAPGAPEGPPPPPGGAQRPTAGLSPAAKTAFIEALNEAKVPADVSPEIKEAQLASALDDLEARLNAHDVPEAQIEAAKRDFEAQVRRQNGIEKPTVTETGEPTPEEAVAATEKPKPEIKPETLPGEMPEPGEAPVGAVETKPGEAVTPETVVPPTPEAPLEPQPLSPAESRAVHGQPKQPTDRQIITAPHMDVRYPLGLLKAALQRFRGNFHREPTPEELHKEADFIAGLHDVRLDDVNKREALGELLDKNPEHSPSRGEIVQKAGEYLDPKNKRTAQDVVNERIAERDKHPDQRFRNVLKKTSALARAKKPLTDEERLQNDLELHREMLAVQAARKGNVLRKQTLAEKAETDRVKAKPPTELPKSKKEGAGAAAKSKTATPKFSKQEPMALYSAVQRFVEHPVGVPDKKDAASWKKWFDNAQSKGMFKKTERQFLGIDAFLDDKKDISLQEIQRFIQDSHRLAIRTTVLNDTPEQFTPEEAKEYDNFRARVRDGTKDKLLTNEEWKRYRELIRKKKLQELPTYFGPNTHHLDYLSWPGGENYEERLLQRANEFSRVDYDTEYRLIDEQLRELRYKSENEPENKALWNERLELEKKQNAILMERDKLGNEFKSPHFPDIINPIAHTRGEERTATTGEKVEHIGEFQSESHQEAANRGYRQPPEVVEAKEREYEEAEIKLSKARDKIYELEKKDQDKIDAAYQKQLDRAEELDEIARKAKRSGFYPNIGHWALRTKLKESDKLYKQLNKELQDAVNAKNNAPELKEAKKEFAAAQTEYDKLDNELYRLRKGVPDIPFKTPEEWVLAAFKDRLKSAIEKGEDAVSWTTGEQQADRYALGMRAESIKVNVRPNANTIELEIKLKGENRPTRFIIDQEGIVTNVYNWPAHFGGDQPAFQDKPLKYALGAEKAKEVLNAKEGTTIAGDDIFIGPKMHRHLYDEVAPKVINDYVKQWGGKVVRAESPEALKFDIPESYKQQERQRYQPWNRQVPQGITAVHSVKITPEMREAILGKEQAAFLRTKMEPLDRERVKSSGIHSIGYDPKSKELEIKFLYGGGVYRYKGVPESVHKALMAADSFGKYFNANIRKAYPAEKVAAFLKPGEERGVYSLPENIPTVDNAVAKLLSERISAWHPGEKAKFEAIPDNALPEDLKPIVGAFTRTGARPVFVKNLTPHIEDFEGVAFGDRLLYINENANHPATALITHEFTHDLKQNSPELYKVLEDEIKSQLDKTGTLPDWAENLKKRGYKDVTDEGAIEELVANGVGDAFSDPKFLEQIAERNPTVFRKIADAFTKFINDLLSKLGAVKDLGSNKYIQDVEAFRNKLLDVLEKYDPKHTEVLRAQGTAFGERISPAFARREPISTAEEAIAEAKKWEKRPVPLGERLLSVINRGPDTLEPTAWQKLTRLMSNTIQPLQDYNEHMARQGTPVAPEADLYKSFTILRGRQAFEQNADHANYVAPIIDAIRVMSKEHGMSEGQFTGLFSQWIRAKDALITNKRHELETIKLTPEAEAKRAPLIVQVRDGTFKGNYLQELTKIVNAPGAKLEQHVEPVSGLTNVEAYKLLKAVKDAGFKDAVGESLNKAFDPLRRRTTENQLRSGSFSEQDVRQQRAYENPYYMPKSDWADEDIRVPQKVFGSPLGAFDRMAYAGRETPADDPVQAAINKLLFSAKDVADNEATATLRNAVLDPNQKLGATIRTYDMDKLANDALAGGKSLANMKKIAAGPRTVIHNRGRFRDVITLPENSQQLRAIKESQAPVPLHGIHKAVAVPTGLYGRFHTALSPSFAMVNAVVRDGLYVPGMMVFQGRTDLLPGYIANYMKYGGPMGAWKAYLTWDGALPRASNFADMEKYALANPDSFAGELYKLEKAGGSFNFRDEFNNAKKLEKLRDEMSRESLSPLNPIRWGHYIIQLQDAVATGSMMAGRVATFVAAKAKGMTDKEAAFYSRRLLDYQQTSEGSRILNSWFAFARVGITSVDAMFSALKDEKGYIDPKRAAMGMMVMGVATTGLYAALKSTLGDDKTKKLSDDALAKNVTIPNGTDTPLQLPIGLGMPRLAWGLSMMAVRLAEGDTTAASAGRTIKNLLMENISPLHPIEAKEGADSGTNAADLAGALVPSILRPGYESFINQTAFGSQIHEAPQYTQGFASEAGRLTTGDLYKELARSLRVHTGLDVYPETIRHILSSYDPGAINLLLKNMEKEDMRAAGLEVDNSQATIFAALLNHDLKYAAGKEYYLSKLTLEDAKKQEDLLKKANKPVPPSIEKQVELDKEFIKASKEHSKAVKTVTSNTLLSTETKTARLAAIQAAWSKTQENLSRQVNQLQH